MFKINQDLFRQQFDRFIRAVAQHDNGEAFSTFREGVVAGWEGYKPRLRDRARGILAPETWAGKEIGSGGILNHAIKAVEIQDRGLVNNLVFWQNRFGHANRDHHVLLEAGLNADLRSEIEAGLFGLYRGEDDEGATFDRLSELTGAKYPLLAYLYYLKDMERFAPIQPTTFDRAFRDLGIELVTVRNCSWHNYERFNAALGEVKGMLEEVGGLAKVRLIDAHSFCWMLARLPRAQGVRRNGNDHGRVLSGRETSIIEMRDFVKHTVGNAHGQIVQRTLKNKELRMTDKELHGLIRSLLDLQGDCCALTGIPFHFHGPDADPPLTRICHRFGILTGVCCS